ncbi:MAG: hypothetical protein IJX67_10995, partial [Oscillospiraceae bacterium]|nr:hypothetical protein [Oscillospiraceae bacterium]
SLLCTQQTGQRIAGISWPELFPRRPIICTMVSVVTLGLQQKALIKDFWSVLFITAQPTLYPIN